MKENSLFKEFRELRQQTIELCESIPLSKIDIIPEGFNNSIRWNLGHILVAWDHAIFPKIKLAWRVPEHYHYTFPKGTSPKTWNTSPPEYIEILGQLINQLNEIIEVSRDKLNEKIAEPFIRIKTLKGMFRFMIREETHHLNCIKRILYATN